jgi:hypothetical protein
MLAHKKPETLGLSPDTDWLPILIRIRDLTRQPELSVLEYVRLFAEKTLMVKQLPEGFFEYWLEDGRTLILLDGLDEVTDHRKAVDFAQMMKYLVDERYPTAEKIGIVLEQLNTHSPASLYKAFDPKEAKRIAVERGIGGSPHERFDQEADKLEFYYTPKHGSWLNMAEIELSVLNRQCLNCRIPDQDTLKLEIAAWEQERNQNSHSVNWQFTTDDARIKLKRLYPSIQS